MIALLALLLAANAAPPLIIQVEPGVEEVELTCTGGQQMRDTVRNGEVSFPVAPDECDVRLVKRSGRTKTNGTWKCTDEACTMERPPHAPISNAPDRQFDWRRARGQDDEACIDDFLGLRPPA